MTRRLVRLRRADRQRDRRRPYLPGEVQRSVLVARSALNDIIVPEIVPAAGRDRLAGFWRGTEFYRVNRIVDRRLEYDVLYYRVITDRGAFELRRRRRMTPWSLRMSHRWELTAELEAIDLSRPSTKP